MSTNAEQLLISAILRTGKLDVAYKSGLNKNQFYIHEEEFNWIEDFYLKRSRVPEKAVFMAKFGRGSDGFRIKEADDVEHFTYEVREAHKLRSVTKAAAKILEQVDDKDGDAALNEMFAASVRISSELGLVNDGDILKDYDDVLRELAVRRERFNKYGTSGIPSGFQTFDERTGGFAPGELWVPAARPGQGKSYFLQKVAITAAVSGYKVMYNALEQPRANVMARILPFVSSNRNGRNMFNTRHLIQGRDYDPEELQEFLEEMKSNIKGNLNVADGTKGRVSVANIAAQIERYHPDVVIVDHISLMERNTHDHAGLAEVADGLTNLANQHQIPVISASQLNRQGTQKGSGLETLAESDKIGQNASGVIMFDRPSKRVVRYTCAKYRNGDSDFSWWALFDPEHGNFKEIDWSEAQAQIARDEEQENDE